MPAPFPAIPGFELLEQIGEGGMGAVYRAREVAGAREVAIKVLAVEDRDERARFGREARVMSGLAHDNIVRVFDHATAGDRQYLVMEYVAGQSLRQALVAGRPLPPRRVAELLRGVGAALACLHERRVVHRDLKPSNILLDAAGRVKLTDFGICSPVAELGDITRTNEFVGSLDYMSPEQRLRLPVDERADQFALAVIAYELLTGRRPVGSFKPPSAVNGRLHASVDPVVIRALAEDPDDRFPDVAGFVDAVTAALARRPARRRAGWLLAATAAAAVVGLAWTWSATTGERRELAADAGVGDAGGGDAGGGDVGGGDAPPPSATAVDWVALGERQLAAGNLDAATKAFDEAVRRDPTDPTVFHHRALATSGTACSSSPSTTWASRARSTRT